MKKIQFYALMGFAVTCAVGLTACASSDVDEGYDVVVDDNGNEGVKPEFVISIPRTVVGTTRMTDATTQSGGSVSQFRGLDNIRLIPFRTEPTKTTAKLADILTLSPLTKAELNSPGRANYKVYADKFVPVGTGHFLFYAKAIDNEADVAITSMDDKFKYGVVNAKGITNSDFTTPGNILFSLEQINSSEEPQASNTIGQNVVSLLTSLANTEVEGVDAPHNKWSTTTDFILATVYKNFTCITTSSSSTLAAALSDLYFTMNHVLPTNPALALANAIKAKIASICSSTPVEGKPLSLKSDYAGYPGNIGLPEGAVRVRWNKATSTFLDVSANYTKDFNTKITDYLYPAALWYYVSTPLKASIDTKSDKYDEETTWSSVINNVYKDAADEVKPGTKSVALNKAAEYAVGRVETKITIGEGTFYDGSGKAVDLTNGFTLKGVLIGGQSSVGYDFKTKGTENMVIYDHNVPSGITAKPNYTTPANHTLALETKSDQVVYAALELVNNGKAFMGFDGTIPAGGTFYLAVKLDPTTAANYQEQDSYGNVLDKIIMQDHVTNLNISIKNGSTFVDRDGNGIPDVYVKDEDGTPIGVDTDGDGEVDPYDITNDGNPDEFITDPEHGGPGWDTDGDGEVDIPVTPDPDTGEYPDIPNVPDGVGSGTNGVPDLTSPGIELGTSVNLEWQQGLILKPDINIY